MISLPWLSLLISFFWFALGSCLGSFLNLCANRLRREESIIWGRSHCDSCGHILGPGELIPLVSYLRQKGKCRHCGKELTVSLFWREVEAGALFLFLSRMPGPPAVLALRLACVCLLLLMAWTDRDEMQLYEVFFLPLGLLFLLLHGLTDGDLFSSLAGAGLLGGLLQLIHWRYPQGMGAGDPKLAAVMGLWLGPWTGLQGLFLAAGLAFLSVCLFAFNPENNGWDKAPVQVPLAPYFVLAGLLLRSRSVFGLMEPDRMLLCVLGLAGPGLEEGKVRLGQAAAWLRRRLSPWPRQLLGVQISGDRVTLVQVRKKKKAWEVERYQELAWPERIRLALYRQQGEEPALWLQEVCAKRGFTAQSILWLLGPDLLEFRNLSLPGLSRKEQIQAASWEILQQIPYPPGSFALGTEPCPDRKEEILAGAVPLALLDTVGVISRQLDWEILQVEGTPAAWGWWLEKEEAGFLLILGEEGLQGAWYARGRLLACRNLPGSGRGEPFRDQRDEAVETLWEHLSPGVRDRFQDGPSGLYLAGGTEPEQAAWLEFFRQQWECPAQVLELEPRFQWAPYYEEKKQAVLTAGLWGVLGGILGAGRESGFCFSLFRQGTGRLSRISWSALGKKLAAVSLILCLWLAGCLFLARKEQERSILQLQQASGWETLWQAQQQRRKQLARQQKEKKQRIRQQVNWGDFLTLLGNQVPSDCWLTRVEQQKEGKVLHLEGRSLKRNGALQLVKRLQQRPEVIQVKLDRLEQEERESDLTGFALQIRLKEEETHG